MATWRARDSRVPRPSVPAPGPGPPCPAESPQGQLVLGGDEAGKPGARVPGGGLLLRGGPRGLRGHGADGEGRAARTRGCASKHEALGPGMSSGPGRPQAQGRALHPDVCRHTRGPGRLSKQQRWLTPVDVHVLPFSSAPFPKHSALLPYSCRPDDFKVLNLELASAMPHSLPGGS